MKITDKVKIGGQIYEVARLAIVDEQNRNTDGQIQYGEGIIKLQDTLKGDYADYVFIHEIMHGIFEYLCMENNENVVDKLARALHMVIKDNPDLFKEGE
jgi:hypothetical protein